MDWTILQGGLRGEGHVQSGQVGFPLLLNKAVKWGQETWIWAFYKLHSFEKRCSEWASGLSLATQQSLGYSQEAWIGRLYKAHFIKEGHVQSAQVGFPLLLYNALTWGQQTWIWPFYKLHSFKEGMFRVGKWAFPCS